ncbi:MAG: DegV family protein [Chloroflexota bacterium]|nr:DegV family protein [Chloroflexota bacterium]
MTVKIVTDSTSDLPPGVAEELDITVVPLYVRFGDKLYRDRIDISEDEFYDRLVHDPTHPGTSQPTPQDFAAVYRKLAEEADGIISIHISSKLSGTCHSALGAKQIIEAPCPIEVIDSLWTSIALGIIVMKLAIGAREGKGFQELVEEANSMIPTIHYLGFFDTLKYLELGGRIGKAQSLVGSILNVKPLLTLKDGEFHPVGRVRTYTKAMDRLFEFVKAGSHLEDVFVVHSTTPDEAGAMADRLGSLTDRKKIIIARLGPVLGVHAGPGTLFVGYR